MRPFSGVDFYDTDALLTEEERVVRDTVRDWVTSALLPVIAGVLRRAARSRAELMPGAGRAGRVRREPPEHATAAPG